MPTFRSGDADLCYEEYGAGPPVLLLHGLGSSARDWEFQIPELARSHRVIAMDARGHGRSSKPPGPYSVAQFAKDAIALLCRLNAVPAHIVGLSMGGMIAFQMAVDTPDAVRSLVIANSGPAMILRTMRLRTMIRLRFLVVRLFGMRALGRMIAGPVFPNAGQEHLQQRFMESIAANDPHAYLDSLRAIIGWSVDDRVGGIRCPVLVISSDHDYTPVEFKREYAARIPHAKVVVIEDSRHVAPMDQPEAFNRVVLDFLSGLTAQ